MFWIRLKEVWDFSTLAAEMGMTWTCETEWNMWNLALSIVKVLSLSLKRFWRIHPSMMELYLTRFPPSNQWVGHWTWPHHWRNSNMQLPHRDSFHPAKLWTQVIQVPVQTRTTIPQQLPIGTYIYIYWCLVGDPLIHQQCFRFTLSALGRYMKLKFLWLPERILRAFHVWQPRWSWNRSLVWNNVRLNLFVHVWIV